jgi:hypothetical protein
LTVDQYHPLRALATLGFPDCGAPSIRTKALSRRDFRERCASTAFFVCQS